MSKASPELQDYLDLFDRYGGDLGSVYEAPEDERYACLFERLIELLIESSPFNDKLPESFRITALRYVRGDSETVARMSESANRRFVLSDLYDFIMLHGGLALKRRYDQS